MKKIVKDDKKWYLYNLEGKILGRASSEIAKIIQGKDQPEFSRNEDRGNYVVVINAEKFKLSGSKMEQKRYYNHSGYIGNLKTVTVRELLEKDPRKILLHSVSGMLPKNKIKDKFLSRLKIYSGSEHPHLNIKFYKEY